MEDITPPSTAGKKRKRDTAAKFYAVRSGHQPGIYHDWNACLKQVTGHKGAVFKSFPSLRDAESFMTADGAFKRPNDPQKFYAVQSGHTPGVYSDWEAASAQIKGWTKPKHRAFSSRAEAEAFVRSGSGPAGITSPAQGSTPDRHTNGEARDVKPAAKKAKVKSGREDNTPFTDENIEHEAGDGPLPQDAEDGFDPRITLNPATGKVEYKSDAHLNATKVQATGPAKDGILRIYTDGSSLGNGAQGAIAGVGVYFGPNDKRNISEPLIGPRQTNQRAELTGILRALELSPRDRPIAIYSDSSYAINCVTQWFQKWRSNGWLNAAKKPVENKDLVEKVLALLEEREHIGRKYADGQEVGGENQEANAWNNGRSRVSFVWVKGHKDDAGNNAADRLAVAGAKEAKENAASQL